MTPMVAALIGSACGLGLLLIVGGLLGRRLLPSSSAGGQSTVDLAELYGNGSTAAMWMVGALSAGGVVLVLTGWWVAAVIVTVVVLSGPRLASGSGAEHDRLARIQAVATWTETVRDNMAGAAGLEQALQSSVALAPRAIEEELGRFGQTLKRSPLDDALLELGDDLDNPAADLVVAALVSATRMEVRELGPLLHRLSRSARAEVAMRQRVQVGRARVRTSARIVVATTLATVVLLSLFSRRLLAVYDSAVGQLWLLVVAAVFTLGAWLLSYYSRLDMPSGFVARRRPSGERR